MSAAVMNDRADRCSALMFGSSLAQCIKFEAEYYTECVRISFITSPRVNMDTATYPNRNGHMTVYHHIIFPASATTPTHLNSKQSND